MNKAAWRSFAFFVVLLAVLCLVLISPVRRVFDLVRPAAANLPTPTPTSTPTPTPTPEYRAGEGMYWAK